MLILGAFGCGAFMNPPEVVAAAARTVVKEYLYCFRVIEFAVYTRRGDTSNYDAFQRTLSIIRQERSVHTAAAVYLRRVIPPYYAIPKQSFSPMRTTA
ncbi:MAG: hypothetical protein E7422_00745 [Ruminococcaceae bacterium]|nr:hypothetical protein [Oscillospiraceae bacterium]